jgi:hypothetical protein
MRIVFDAELNGLGNVLARHSGHHPQPKIEARRNAAPGDDVAIDHRALGNGYGTPAVATRAS